MPDPAIMLSPKPGFDWTKVNWGAPNQTRTRVCSYCGDPFPDEDDDEACFIPLIMWNKAGWCAEFCDHCQATWWGVQQISEPVTPRHEPEVRAAGRQSSARLSNWHKPNHGRGRRRRSR